MQRLFQLLSVSCLFLCLASCVSDVDFDQTENIVIGPTVDVNLAFFEIDASVYNPTATVPVLTLRDTTRLELLEAGVVDEHLRQIDFTHQFNNQTPQEFEARIVFLTEDDVEQYEITFPISPNGTTTNTDVVVQPQLEQVLASVKVVIELTIIPNTLPISGTIKHRSKGVFYLTIDDL